MYKLPYIRAVSDLLIIHVYLFTYTFVSVLIELMHSAKSVKLCQVFNVTQKLSLCYQKYHHAILYPCRHSSKSWRCSGATLASVCSTQVRGLTQLGPRSLDIILWSLTLSMSVIWTGALYLPRSLLWPRIPLTIFLGHRHLIFRYAFPPIIAK